MASQGALELDSVLQKRASKGLKGWPVSITDVLNVSASRRLLATSEDFRWMQPRAASPIYFRVFRTGTLIGSCQSVPITKGSSCLFRNRQYGDTFLCIV